MAGGADFWLDWGRVWASGDRNFPGNKGETIFLTLGTKRVL